MTTSSNTYCDAIGIPPPRVEDAKSSPDANYYGLLIVALLDEVVVGQFTTKVHDSSRLS